MNFLWFLFLIPCVEFTFYYCCFFYFLFLYFVLCVLWAFTVFSICYCFHKLQLHLTSLAPVLLDFYWDSISPQPYDIPCLYHFTKLSDGSFCLFFGSGLNSPKEWLWFAPQNKVTHTVPFFFITSGKWQVDRVTASKCSVRSHHSSLDLIFLVDTLNV